VFDPFKDFDQAGYLRNSNGEKDPEIVQTVEHALFRAQLGDALKYLEKCRTLNYQSFLDVHRILFSGFYPWAGKDRRETAPDSAISKAGLYFAQPQVIQRAVEEGFRIAKDKKSLRKRCGDVMGYFAFGHPFLDGNGRTMLVIHSELCHRAGFSISWMNTRKEDYLAALTQEIQEPNRGTLNDYLQPFITDGNDRAGWGGIIGEIPGLDGRETEDIVEETY